MHVGELSVILEAKRSTENLPQLRKYIVGKGPTEFWIDIVVRYLIFEKFTKAFRSHRQFAEAFLKIFLSDAALLNCTFSTLGLVTTFNIFLHYILNIYENVIKREQKFAFVSFLGDIVCPGETRPGTNRRYPVQRPSRIWRGPLVAKMLSL